MANNFKQSSSFMRVPEDRLPAAREIIGRIEREQEDNDEPLNCIVDVWESDRADETGVSFESDESIEPSHVERLARALVDGLELDEPFVCSWSEGCDDLRTDEFGGGAFVVKRGFETYWCDAVDNVRRRLEEERLVPLAPVPEDRRTMERLEELRGELRMGNISYGELHELQTLAGHIPADDTELLEAAGVPEFPEDDPAVTFDRRTFQGAYVFSYWRKDRTRGEVQVFADSMDGALEMARETVGREAGQ